MNNVDANINLCGEYRIKVIENDAILSDSGWCKNTILSGGLVRLAYSSFDDNIKFLDLGISNALSSTESFYLSGILQPSSNSTLTNISRDNFQIIYNKTFPNLRTYYTAFTTQFTNSISETIREFAVKPSSDGITSGFARSVLSTPVTVRFNQAVNFEYRLSVDWSSYIAKNFTPFRTAEFTIGSSLSTYNTFYIPTTSTIYNIPEDKIFNPLTQLIVCKNNESLPRFGDTYPASIQYAINTEEASTFNPTVLSAYLDPDNKCFNVITQYSNISASPGMGIISDVNTLILTSPETETNFLATRFILPLTLYNYESLSDVVEGLSSYDVSYDIYRQNAVSFNYRYVWGELLYSTLDSYYTNSAVLPNIINEDQEIPCEIYQTISCGRSPNVRVLGTPVTYKTRVIIGTDMGDLSLNYNCNNTTVRFLAIYYPNDNTSLSAVQLIDSGYRGVGEVFTPQLNNIGYPNVTGSQTGTITFTKSLSTYTFVDIVTYSPLTYAGTDTYVELNLTCPS